MHFESRARLAVPAFWGQYYGECAVCVCGAVATGGVGKGGAAPGGARWETYVCARSAGGRWADRALLRTCRRPFGRFSWVSISFVDRDLIVPKSESSTYFRACG